LLVCAGGSLSFGVSANAVPDIRKNDNTIAASFFISSLIDRAGGHPSVSAIFSSELPDECAN
jgi:hypothetical protein